MKRTLCSNLIVLIHQELKWPKEKNEENGWKNTNKEVVDFHRP